MRRVIAFPCAGETLVGTLDEAAGSTGLLIVSGGNEIRMGAHRGMAMLAARVATELDAPVFRYDRRGIGDSSGRNGGFESSADDLKAATAAFRAETGIERIVAFGNCDAATSLAFFGPDAGVDALLLGNPWTIEATDNLPPAAAIRARYAERLKDPREWLRLLRGGVNIYKLVKGLIKVAQKPSQPPASLAARLGQALGHADRPVTVLAARGDNTAIAFLEAWHSPAFAEARTKANLIELDSDSHSFATPSDKDWLFDRVRAALHQ